MEITEYNLKIQSTNAGYYLHHRGTNCNKFYATKGALLADIDNINIAANTNAMTGTIPGAPAINEKVKEVVTLIFAQANGGGTINGVIGVLQRQTNPPVLLTVHPSTGLLSTYLTAFTF